MAKTVKIEFIKEFAGKPKGYVGEYSIDNANSLIAEGVGKEYTEKVAAKKVEKEPKK
jgi:hypothetical protein